MKTITEQLFDLRDEAYAEFQRKLIPTVSPDRIMGVRTPDVRSLAREVAFRDDVGSFLVDLPHHYFDENLLHAFILSARKDFGECVDGVGKFLPYVDNWATCDQLSPKVFAKNPRQLLPFVRRWLRSRHEYTVRFAIGMLMQHYLDDHFRVEYASRVAAVKRPEYYVRMMQAWYFATALAKQYDQVLPFLRSHQLEAWTHNKAIQKAVESRRLSEEQKTELRGLRVKGQKPSLPSDTLA